MLRESVLSPTHTWEPLLATCKWCQPRAPVLCCCWPLTRKHRPLALARASNQVPGLRYSRIGTLHAIHRVITLASAFPGLEAYRLLQRDPTPRGVTFEGFYSAEVHSLAYADTEWSHASFRWNEPTQCALPPGQRYRVVFRLAVAPSIRGVNAALGRAGLPVATSVPGYIITQVPRDSSILVILLLACAAVAVIIGYDVLHLKETCHRG